MAKSSQKNKISATLLALAVSFNSVAMAETSNLTVQNETLSQSTYSMPSEERRTFNYIAPKQNLGQTDLIHSGTESMLGKWVLGVDIGMTNFNYFLDHGDMKFQGPLSAVSIDFEKDDAINKIIREAIEETRSDVQKSEEYQALITADQPTLEQRYAYEQVLANAAFDHIEEKSGLHQYRLDQFSAEKNFKVAGNLLPDNDLNKLSQDTNKTADATGQYNFGLECEKMSALKGLVMQAVENDLLPIDEGTFNTAGSYFNAQGYQYHIGGFTTSVLGEKDFDADRGGHAFISSAKSGAIFEATANTATPREYNTGEFKSLDARILVPVLGTIFDGTEVNENFETLASGSRVYYAPMDSEQPGRMATNFTASQIIAYQVGSSDDKKIERFNAIYAGEYDKLNDLTSGHEWGDDTVEKFKSEIPSYELYYRMYKESRNMEAEISMYDPENKGPEAFLRGYLEINGGDLSGVSGDVFQGYQDYIKQGREIPETLLSKIAQSAEAPDELGSLNISLQIMAQRYDKEIKKLPKIKKIFEEKGFSGYLTSPVENFLKGERVQNLKEASKMVSSISSVYERAREYKEAKSQINTQSEKHFAAINKKVGNPQI